MLASWALRILHFLYAAIVFVTSSLKTFRRAQPQPLTAHRRKLPSHLCLLLVSDSQTDADETESAFLECVRRTVAWCRAVGIENLTAYDREGVLVKCSGSIREHMRALDEHIDEDSTESEVEYPLTPPLSEPSVSRSTSPDPAKLPVELDVVTIRSSESRLRVSPVKRRRNIAVRRRPPRKDKAPLANQLTLHIISRDSSKPAIASAARSLIRSEALKSKGVPSASDYELSIAELNAVLEGGLPSPDFMIVHHVSPTCYPRPPLELHGFPPWQITLSEMHRTHTDGGSFTWPYTSVPSERALPLDEAAFCRALDEYAGAEMRLGK
ncbi:hypothetical protein BV22DRAFT_1105075 [Leucogyrophana mollusca]|uniref:Uncharacterized protein n=1 Tax=Leucogyrophana mollusca TaxID=85980 RepID=A0ACB8BHI9_9AGAM|nr:hypothetical protein BV22DRAFT_1105075 [Leucogyrophana mollusca]